jgi:hypothetical protein
MPETEGQEPKVDVFRFVTVRAPQRIAGEPQSRTLLRFDENGRQPPLHKILVGALIQRKAVRVRGKLPTDAVKAVRALAAKWLAENSTRLDKEQYKAKSRLEQLYRLFLSFGINSEQPVTVELLQSSFQNIFETNPSEIIGSDQYNALHQIIWETLYALFAIGSGSSGDIDSVITLIRAMALVKELSIASEYINGEGNFEALLDGIPVLPNDLFPVVGDMKTPETSDISSKTFPLISSIDFASLSNLLPFQPLALSEDVHTDPPAPYILVRPLGVADLRVVKQSLARYGMGEITHIENVLQTEKRERRHRYLRRTEESFTIETEKQKEEERNLQSTDKLELQRESSKTIQENFNIQAGVQIAGSYGPVSISANAGFSYSRAQSESLREASNFSKEIVDESRRKIIERIQEERSKKTTEEIEEINTHAFENNRDGAQDVSGIYRWVNKIYNCQIYNYGKRLMFEFVIPEPAAFYRYIAEVMQQNTGTLKMPKPLPSSFTPSQITSLSGRIDSNTEDLIREYSVEGIEPPPPETITVGTTLQSETASGDWGQQSLSKADLAILGGYAANTASIHFNLDTSNRGPVTVAWSIGHASGLEVTPDADSRTPIRDEIPPLIRRSGMLVNDDHTNPNGVIQFSKINISMRQEVGTVPITVSSIGTSNLVVGVEITARRTQEELFKWQLKTYDKIIQKYNILLAEYEEQKTRLEARNQGLQNRINGSNSLRNRETIEEELKKHCVTMLTGWQYDGFDAMEYPASGEPRIRVEEALKEGTLIRFFEQAFEWDKITYQFYPYFWGRRSRWDDVLKQESDDPLFKNFLRAGAVKVVLAVIPGLTEAILWYLKTGELRIGSSMPAIEGDVEYLSIVDEVRGQADDIGGGVAEGEPWEVILPTSLVILHSQGEQLDTVR